MEEAAQIRLAEAHVHLEEFDQARTVLKETAQANRPLEFELEFLQISAMVAVGQKDRKLVGRIIEELRKLDEDEPYFRSARDQLCIELMEFVLKVPEGEPWQLSATLQTLLRNVARVCRYLILKPNFFGMGVDLNKVIEGAAAHSQQVKSRGQAEQGD